MPRRLIDECRCRGYVIVKISGEAIELADWQRNVFRIGAADGLAEQVPLAAHIVLPLEAEIAFPAAEIGIDNDMITDLEFLHAGTQRGDLPGSVCSVDVRQFQIEPGPALADQDIHAVQGRRVETDQDLARLRIGGREIDVLEDLGPSMYAE